MKTQVSEFKKSALTIKKEEDKEEYKEEDSAEEAVEDISEFLRKGSTIIFISRLFQGFLKDYYKTEIEEMCTHKR